MPRTRETAAAINLSDAQYYFNRELSWLEFNRRVLHEAMDDRTPLLERLKFLGIFTSNLDEFFMVRVSALKEQVVAGVTQRTPDGRSPQEQLEAICQHLRPIVDEQHRHFEFVLRSKIASHGIYLLNYMDLNQEQRTYLQAFFEKRIFPVLTPLAVDPGHPFPFISNLSLNLAVNVKHPETGEELFARVKVPSILPRFVALPRHLQQPDNGCPTVWTGVPLEQVIAHNLEALFPGMTIQEYYLFRITRDTDFELQEDEADDLLQAIEQEVRKRYMGVVVRMEIHATMPAAMRQTLMEEMNLTETDVYEVDGLLNLKDLMSLLSLPLPELKDPPYTPRTPARLRSLIEATEGHTISGLEDGDDFFSIIRAGDLLVHHPYESFSASVERFITQAAHDPQVLTIKMTLYRTSSDSPIPQALIAAAENGKQVVALVELKARFDEENNINWARRLEKVGVHVVYGLVGLKTHTKVVLVVRQEGNYLRRYVHIGTGNYNPKTARLYTDLGLLSCREDLGADLTDLFNYLTGYSRQRSYRKLLVSPVNQRDRINALIRREIDHCRAGNPGRIIAKMNSLVDAGMIEMLYEASQAGVQIDLIIRGICCLRPGIRDVSENIRVASIIGRYLEHSRIFYFGNNSQPEYYIGSADWMPRNLDRRVEAVAPIEDEAATQALQTMLDTLLADNRQAWDLQSDGCYVQRRPDEGEPERSAQTLFMWGVSAERSQEH
jgi:polyphosphate kinase